MDDLPGDERVATPQDGCSRRALARGTLGERLEQLGPWGIGQLRCADRQSSEQQGKKVTTRDIPPAKQARLTLS